MKIKRIFTTSLLFSLLIISYESLAADENDTTFSNVTNFSYPNHPCNNKPEKPIKPEKLSTYEKVEDYNNAISNYNVRVVEYNKEIKNYKSCINQYIKNGNQDINTIREKLNSALKEARKK